MFNRVRSFAINADDLSVLVPDADIELLPSELRELYDNWVRTDDAAALNQSCVAESDWPVAIYVPERYEPRYAYPLVIWLHSDDTDEDQLEDVMGAISCQNYCGLSLRGNSFNPQSGGFRWNTNALQFGEAPMRDLIHITTCRLRRAFHIHSERIFIAGAGSGADAALQILVQRPDWFAGAILLDPVRSADEVLSERLTGLRGKPILHSAARSSANHHLASHVERIQLLRSAGAELDVHLTDQPLDPVSNEVRFLDYWIMDKLNRTALV